MAVFVTFNHGVELAALTVKAGLALASPGLPLAVKILLNKSIRHHRCVPPVIQQVKHRLLHPGLVNVLIDHLLGCPGDALRTLTTLGRLGHCSPAWALGGNRRYSQRQKGSYGNQAEYRPHSEIV